MAHPGCSPAVPLRRPQTPFRLQHLRDHECRRSGARNMMVVLFKRELYCMHRERKRQTHKETFLCFFFVRYFPQCCCGPFGLQSYQCWTDGPEDVKFFSGAAEAAAALTSDKVTAAAVAEVFTIWITGIILLLFDSALRESALTSAVMWLCRLRSGDAFASPFSVIA